MGKMLGPVRGRGGTADVTLSGPGSQTACRLADYTDVGQFDASVVPLSIKCV